MPQRFIADSSAILWELAGNWAEQLQGRLLHLRSRRQRGGGRDVKRKAYAQAGRPERSGRHRGGVQL